MRDTQPETQEEKPSPILIISAKEMEKQIGEDEMYRIHKMVVSSLEKDLLKRWEVKEVNKVEEVKNSIQRFIIFYPKDQKEDNSLYKIHSMLSGEVPENGDKKIYTIINTASEEKREGNATKLLKNLAILIGEDNEIRGSLNLKLNSNATLQKLDREQKENIVKELNGNFKIISGVIEFDKKIINDKNRIFIEEIKAAKLWEAINFKFLSSFKEAPGLNFKLEVGSDTGDIILAPAIIIDNKGIEYAELKTSPKHPVAVAVSINEKSGEKNFTNS